MRDNHPSVFFRVLVAAVVAPFFSSYFIPEANSQTSDKKKLDAVYPIRASLVRFDFGAPCTGTLISPNLILTASHCVAPFKTGMPVHAFASSPSEKCNRKANAKSFINAPGSEEIGLRA